MKRFPVIPSRCMYHRIPIGTTALWLTVLKCWNAPEWLWGVVGMFLVLVWICWGYWIVASKEITDPPFDK